jgi:hypothetical protein
VREQEEGLAAAGTGPGDDDGEMCEFLDAAERVLEVAGGSATQMVFGSTWKRLYPEVSRAHALGCRVWGAGNMAARVVRGGPGPELTPAASALRRLRVRACACVYLRMVCVRNARDQRDYVALRKGEREREGGEERRERHSVWRIRTVRAQWRLKDWVQMRFKSAASVSSLEIAL